MTPASKIYCNTCTIPCIKSVGIIFSEALMCGVSWLTMTHPMSGQLQGVVAPRGISGQEGCQGVPGGPRGRAVLEPMVLTRYQGPDRGHRVLTGDTGSWPGTQGPDRGHRVLTGDTGSWPGTQGPDRGHRVLTMDTGSWPGTQSPDRGHRVLTGDQGRPVATGGEGGLSPPWTNLSPLGCPPWHFIGVGIEVYSPPGILSAPPGILSAHPY